MQEIEITLRHFELPERSGRSGSNIDLFSSAHKGHCRI